MHDQPAISEGPGLAPASRVALADAQTADRDQGLAPIFEIAKILATEQDLEAMLPKFLSSLIETVEAADTGILLLHDPADGQLTVKGAQGYDFGTLSQIRLAPGEAMSGRALQTGQAELYPTPEVIAAVRSNLTPENRDLFAAATARLSPPQSVVCVPLVSGQTRVGALVLENRRGVGGFVNADLPFLQALADLIAFSIESARLREELQVTRALEEANRLKAELISMLAHEMRTPLTSIKGYSTALLMEEATFSPETQREFLQIVDEECDVLQDLIHDLLESSVIDAGLLKLEPQPVMLPRVAQSVTDDIARRTQKHRVLVDFPERFPIVDADPHRIEQVLRNLLDNAVKYSPAGGLVVVRGEARKREVVISVADQGGGIAPEHLNRLFEKFYRIESALGRHVVGSGLGLPIARTIVESHGGRIWAESQVGEGSTFFFTLPREGPSEERGRAGGGETG
jgi:signal transduction histidine kinase